MLARLAPNDQPHLCRERLAQRHRRGLVLASFPPHNPAMLRRLFPSPMERDRRPTRTGQGLGRVRD